MNQRVKLRMLLVLVALIAMSVPGFPQSKKNISDDVAMELIGQVLNPSATSSIQVGYLSYINGIDAPIFSGSLQNESTAFFTFYSDTTTTRVINNGSMRIINRVGTFTIYLDTAPNGDFASPDTFRDGTPVFTASLRHQVIIDTVTSSFTATFVLTVSSGDFFRLG